MILLYLSQEQALNTFVHPVDTNADGNESVSVDEDDDLIIYLNSVTTSPLMQT
jgi:hypothetical protein